MSKIIKTKSISLIVYSNEYDKYKKALGFTGLLKEVFHSKVINTSIKKINKPIYKFKYDNFVRIQTYKAQLKFDLESYNAVKELSDKFKKPKTTILREIFCTYLEN
ncbi:MAG: hypothetical protein IPH62_15375 [Ignavibacteriae bacterium]|nr:hypothetical protein [Ignavibacteriota bacterium]